MIHARCNLGAGIGELQEGWCYYCWTQLNPELWRQLVQERAAKVTVRSARVAPLKSKPATAKPRRSSCCPGSSDTPEYSVRLDLPPAPE